MSSCNREMIHKYETKLRKLQEAIHLAHTCKYTAFGKLRQENTMSQRQICMLESEAQFHIEQKQTKEETEKGV